MLPGKILPDRSDILNKKRRDEYSHPVSFPSRIDVMLRISLWSAYWQPYEQKWQTLSLTPKLSVNTLSMSSQYGETSTQLGNAEYFFMCEGLCDKI